MADWMVPELSLAVELHLESSKRAVRAAVSQQPKQVAELTCSLMQQLVAYQSIVRKATHHVAELEASIVLGAAPEADPQKSTLPEGAYCVAVQKVPWLLRRVLRLYGFELVNVRATD